MKLLFAFRHRRSADPFVLTMELLASRGHQLALVLQEPDDRTAWMFRGAHDVSIDTLAAVRSDEWGDASELVRYLRDYVQYLDPPYRGAAKLRRRVFERLVKKSAAAKVPPQWSEDALLDLSDAAREQLKRSLAVIEAAIPTDPAHDRLLERVQPDAVVVSPLMHFGSAQAEVVKSARRRGIPAIMLLSSWDNLSTKGALHAVPDRIFVWNEMQRREAFALHNFPEADVRVVGAARFDGFFTLSSRVSRDDLARSLGVPPATDVLLYLCSSRLVSEKEVNFIREWVGAIRGSAEPRLRDALLLVRPHPDLPWRDARWLAEERPLEWPGLAGADLRARMLFNDPRTQVVTSDLKHGGLVLYESIFHSRAVIGLNTSAEIEAGIVGRPVFTITAPTEVADGQSTTIHFHYLTEEHGGFVRRADSLAAHVEQLREELESPRATAEIQRHVEAFVRPHGRTRPVSELLADALESELAQLRRVPAADGREAGAPLTPAIVKEDSPAQPSHAGLQRLEWHGATLWFRGGRSHAEVWSSASQRTASWLVEQLSADDVVYDLAAAIGVTAVAVAKVRRCTVVAFEPNLAAIACLWQNALFNRCDGSIVPIAARVSGHTELVAEHFSSFEPGAERTAARAKRWRPHESISGEGLIQPALTVRASALPSWKLPRPTAVRAVLDRPESDVLSVIEELLAEHDLRVVVVEAATPALAETLRAWGVTRGFTSRVDDSGAVVCLLSRTAARA